MENYSYICGAETFETTDTDLGGVPDYILVGMSVSAKTKGHRFLCTYKPN